MARPRKNTQALEGAYSKEDMRKRLEVESRLRGSCDKLTPPQFLLSDEVALNKFYELVDELSRSEIIGNVDKDLLATYCDCWSKYVRTTKILLVQDLVEEQENKLGAITKVQNPYIKIQQSYLDRMLKLSSLFGLSPADRSKIAHLNPSEKDEKVDPLLQLISGLQK